MSFLQNLLKEYGIWKFGIAIGSVFLVLLMSLFIYIYSSSDGKMVVLYSDLNMEDSGKIINELESKKIAYELTGNGSIIKVAESNMLRVRVAMAQEGLPNRGNIVGYEIFNNEETLGATSFQQNIKMVRALEGELSRTISSFDQVARARVHLVLPQKEVFSREKQDPKASVVLTFKNMQNLGKSEIDAIGHLVATAVPGLDIKNVTIVDTKGRSLKLSSQDQDFERYGGGSGNTAEEYRSAYEKRMKNMLENLLEKSLGAGKVKTQISADMNFDRVVTNSEIYDPDSAVIRSVQSIEERERTPLDMGDNIDLSVANNIPGGDAGAGSNNLDKDASVVQRSDETTNYEISRTIKNQVSETGNVKQLSIAVLVDGIYVKNASGELQYTPRSDEELKKIENLVKVAVGFREERGDKVEIINMQFISSDLDDVMSDKSDWIKSELPELFQTLVLGVVVALVFITVIRPIIFKLFETQQRNAAKLNGEIDTKSATNKDSVSITSGGNNSLESPLVDANSLRIGQMMQSYPDEALVVLRRWLNESN